MKQLGILKQKIFAICPYTLLRVKPGKYTRSQKNKAYALSAHTLIKENPKLLMNKELWSLVIGNSDKQHNSQMDVVTSLLIDGVIKQH